MSTSAPPVSASARARAAALRTTLLPLLVLVPVVVAVDRPVMIDDTLFLKAATQILSAPTRPYDFTVNWYGTPEAFWDVFKNPPGMAYWLALVRWLGATGERGLHLACLPFAIAAVLGGVRLARRFVAAPGLATAAWAASPAFVVAAATLMADVPALALGLWALALWIEGVDADRIGRRRLGALLAGFAVVAKYTSAVGLGAMAAYVLVARRERRGLEDLWVASLPLFAWGLLTLGTVERVHFVDALVVRGGGLDPNPGWIAHRGIALLTFVAGTGVAPLVLAVAGLRGRRGLAHAALAIALGVVAALLVPFVWPPRLLHAGAQAAVAILAAAGALALLRGVGALEDRDDGVLAVWLALQVAFLWLWSWSIASRFVLPLLVPLALLLTRRLARERPALAPRVLGLGVAAALAVAVVVLHADGFAGELHRRALPRVAEQAKREHRTVYFVGAWGFQHYAERAGFARLDVARPQARPGDLVLQPFYAANSELPGALVPRLRELGSLAAPAPPLDVHTMNINVGAGYHSSAYGPLPFFPAHLPAEGVKVWVVGR